MSFPSRFFGDWLRGIRDGLLARARIRWRNPDARVASSVRVIGDARRIKLGPGSYIGHGTVLNTLNGGGLADSSLTVGQGSFIGEYNNIRCAGSAVVIGRNCLIAQFVSIVGSNHGLALGRPMMDQAWEGGPVTIGDDVWIGVGGTVLPGISIGAGAVIAAGAVLTKDVAPDAVVGGIPARVLTVRGSSRA